MEERVVEGNGKYYVIRRYVARKLVRKLHAHEVEESERLWLHRSSRVWNAIFALNTSSDKHAMP